MTDTLLEVTGLDVEFAKGPERVKLVDDVSLRLAMGEVLGIVGESGSGKSLTCRAIIRLLPPNIGITAGRIVVDGIDLAFLPENALGRVRGRKIGMIFQNPASFLDPVMSIGDQIGEAFRVHMGLSRKEALAEAVELLRHVGIPDPSTQVHAYAHELSGGMKQRAMIAAALACQPEILIADEPTTALDVTIQAQILRLLLDLKDRLGLSTILVTHDLSVVSQTCGRIVVMYAGRVMEHATNEELLVAPRHPYSQGLIGSQPELAAPRADLPTIPGQPPGSMSLPLGCRFEPRCTMSQPICRTDVPDVAPLPSGRGSACHFWRELET